jgi:hypothetical protein
VFQLVAVSSRRQFAPAFTIRAAPLSFATHALIVVASLAAPTRFLPWIGPTVAARTAAAGPA